MIGMIGLFALIAICIRHMCLSVGLFPSPTWGHVQAVDRCTSYGIRGYSAVLLNGPYLLGSSHRACRDTELTVRNIRSKASQCHLLVSSSTELTQCSLTYAG
jgi:hypothetical protein